MINDKVSIPVGSYLNATGAINYGMTNDYMFRAVLQKNQNVLKGLICSVLRLREDEVQSVQIVNPIELGEDMNDKTFVLDINLVLNNNTLINLEMQMENEKNWEERSLSYLCRSFDQLYSGEKYVQAKPAVHIGFLNFTPFAEAPEFYATYQMLNVKNHRRYSDKFTLSVVDLTHIELATEEDKISQLDYWAKLFTATSWEELKMIAEKNTSMSEATQTLYELNADIITQEKCRARREYYRRMNTINRDMENALRERDAAFTERDAAFTERDAAFTERDVAFTERDVAFTERDVAFTERDAAFAKRDEAFAELDKTKSELELLKKQLEELRK